MATGSVGHSADTRSGRSGAGIGCGSVSIQRRVISVVRNGRIRSTERAGHFVGYPHTYERVSCDHCHCKRGSRGHLRYGMLELDKAAECHHSISPHDRAALLSLPAECCDTERHAAETTKGDLPAFIRRADPGMATRPRCLDVRQQREERTGRTRPLAVTAANLSRNRTSRPSARSR